MAKLEWPAVKKMEVVLPVPMPTWNRLLAMNRFGHKKVRHLVHAIVAKAVDKRPPSESEEAEYMALIRPSKKNKSRAASARKKRNKED